MNLPDKFFEPCECNSCSHVFVAAATDEIVYGYGHDDVTEHHFETCPNCGDPNSIQALSHIDLTKLIHDELKKKFS